MPTALRRLGAACALALPLACPCRADPPAEPADPFGRFEASGARLGMPLDQALDAMASSKPAWASAISVQKPRALADCSTQGRALLDLAYSGGMATAMMAARCEPGPHGSPALTELVVKGRTPAPLTAQDVRSALASRYGQPAQAEQAPGGGFSMVWIAEPSGPGSPKSESLTAVLVSSPVDNAPQALTLRLSSLPSKPAEQGARAQALGALPF